MRNLSPFHPASVAVPPVRLFMKTCESPETRTRTIPFKSNPLDVQGLFFRVRKCRFPKPGLYWVQFWYNEQMIAQQALLLR
jgi:hypothetical protein